MPDNNPIISVKDLKKTFKVTSPEKKLLRRVCNFVFPKYRFVTAVDGISFTVQKGERVAFIGPNGAGKSTTIKLLTGILHADSGEIHIANLNPTSDSRALAYKIGALIGHRSQLWSHLSPMRSFQLLATIYSLKKEAFESQLNKLCELLQLEPLIHRPVKELSLGQRMRCELTASLLHNPEILFLDEPTIGLDVVSKNAIRKFIKNLSIEQGTTIFLCSHDTTDIEQICDRTMIIDKGRIVTDASLNDVKLKYMNKKRIKVTTNKAYPWTNHKGITIQETTPFMTAFEVDMQVHSCTAAIQKILADGPVNDLTVEDLPLEEIIREIYVGENA